MLEQLLNAAEVVPQVSDGKVTLRRTKNNLWGPVVSPDELKREFGLTAEDLRLDEHPEGADRGGYVPFAGGARYDECFGEWL